MHVIPYNFNEKSQRNGIFHDDWFQWEFNDSVIYLFCINHVVYKHSQANIYLKSINRIENSFLIHDYTYYVMLISV